jgi:hypothetical protein
MLLAFCAIAGAAATHADAMQAMHTAWKDPAGLFLFC